MCTSAADRPAVVRANTTPLEPDLLPIACASIPVAGSGAWFAPNGPMLWPHR